MIRLTRTQFWPTEIPSMNMAFSDSRECVKLEWHQHVVPEWMNKTTALVHLEESEEMCMSQNWVKEKDLSRKALMLVKQCHFYHPQFHHCYRWYRPFPNGWFIMALTTLYGNLSCKFSLKPVRHFFPASKKWWEAPTNSAGISPTFIGGHLVH